MLTKVLILFLLCVASAKAGYKEADCNFNLMEDFKYPIMFIYQRGNYILPDEKPNVKLNDHTQLLLYCPQSEIVLTGYPTVEAACVATNKLKISGRNYGIDEVDCTMHYYSDYQNTNRACGDGKGTIFEIGYNVPGKKFYPLYEVCHQQNIGKTFYTQHEFRRYSKPDELIKLKGPAFQPGPFYRQIKNVYDEQTTTLNSLLGKTAADKITKYHKLSRGHLTPSADFVLSGSRRATYQAINTAPQWASINNGNWKQLEEQIRTRASKYHADLQIITGTYGVLKLPNSSGTLTEIYLDGEKMPVPEIIWKVVYHQNQGIAFISVNTPLSSDKKELCNSICTANMWGNWVNYSEGRIYCCEVSVLQNLLPYIPVTGITRILKGN